MIKALWNIIKNTIKWFLGSLLNFIWLMLPLGFHVFFVQMREKIDVLPALPLYVSENSTWMAVYDGVVLVNTNPGAVRKKFRNVRMWFEKNARILILLVVLLVGVLITLCAVKYMAR